jgi:C4-dicarboxylate-specific signal transduction histidine kinase
MVQDHSNGVKTTGAVVAPGLDATTALARSELKYRDLFNYMPLSMCQLDVSELVKILGTLRAQGIVDLHAHLDEHPELLAHMLQNMLIEQANEHTVKMFGGTDPAEFVGPIARFWQGSEDTMRRSLAARYAGAEAYAEETRLRTLDGRMIDVFYTSAFPKALSELGIGLVGMIDIGDRIRAERMLQQVQAEFAHAARVATLGELTASIAHEINQPLAAIATNAEASLRWLARPDPDVEEVRTLAARIVADARRAGDVISHIRAMATGHIVDHELVSLNGAVEDALGIIRGELRSHAVTVQFAAGADLAPVLADRTQIQRVLVNLALNAVQALADQPAAARRLTVRTGVDADGWARIDVEDNGPGIPEAYLARLFDSFFTTKDTGLGIGLSICRSIIEAHGGRISCDNLPGGGARFTIILPFGAESNSGASVTANHT